jgi:MFS family permease
MRHHSSVLVYIFYLAYGIALSGLGAAWPVIHTELHAPSRSLGLVFLLYGAGRAVAAVAVVRFKPSLFLSPVVTSLLELFAAVGLALSFVAENFALFVVGYTVFGLAAGGLDASLSIAALRIGQLRMLLAVNASFAVGTVCGPLLYVLSRGHFTLWHWSRVAIFLVPAIALFFISAIGAVQSHAESIDVPEQPIPIGRKRESLRYLIAFAAVIVAVAGTESTLGAWIPSLATTVWNYSGNSGSFAVSIYWIAFALARLAATRISMLRSPIAVVLSAGALAAVGWLLIAHELSLLFVVSFIAGFALGPMYPIALAIRTPQGTNPSAVGNAILMGTIGSALIPAFVGLFWPSSAEPILIVAMALPLISLIPYLILSSRRSALV